MKDNVLLSITVNAQINMEILQEKIFKHSGQLCTLKIKIPANTEAEIRLPDGRFYQVGCGEYGYEIVEEHR